MSDSDIARLRREIEELKREKKAAEAREEKERREKEQLIRENQPTTLDEFLRNCHSYLYQNFKLADKSVSSTGSTRVDGKFYPKWLRPWTRFADALRQQQFDVITGACGGERLFNQESTTRDIGRSISYKLAGNENAVTYFEDEAWKKVWIQIPARSTGLYKVLENVGSRTTAEAAHPLHECDY
ncbi:hypothetical protein TruAng_012249 [Truncatella angustata]|nr:hypothetical protein TruAng_012249 [Truncatella angustata]